MSKFQKAKVDPKAQKSSVTMGTRKSATMGTRTTPVQPKGSMKDPKAPSKFPAPKDSPIRPKEDSKPSEVTKKNLTAMNSGPKDHIKKGVDSVVTTKEALLWQKNSNPISTVKSNVKALVTGKVNSANQNEKLKPGERGKLAVMGALNMVPGVGSVANLTNGIVTSVKNKNEAKKTEFNKGNVVYKTPVKSVPEGGTVSEAKTNSKKTERVVNSPFGGLKKNK